MAYEAFISYETYSGTSYAEHLKGALEKSNENRLISFLARKDLLGSQNWREVIDSALKEAPLFIIIFTSLTNSSEEMKRECEMAIELNKIILTFRWQKIPLEETEKLVEGLIALQQIEFDDKYELANLAIYEINNLRRSE